MPNITIPSKLEPFLTKKKRFKVAFGGRGGAKSQTVADMLLFLVQTEGHKVGCFRELMNSIDDSVHSLLRAEVERMELQGFTATDSKIINSNGGEIRYKGLSRNPDAVKSMHGFTRFWVEEAQSISQESLNKLTPTLREEGSEIWFTLNTESSEDPISKRFIVPFYDELLTNGFYEDDLHYIVWINYNDNPWFPEVLEQERIFDYQNRPRAEYDHVWLGHFNDSVDNAVIKTEWFDAAIDAHKILGFKPRGQRIVTHDPSDSRDAKAIVDRHGSVILNALENTKDDVNDGCDWALDYAISNKADVFRWDCDGLGISLRKQVNDSLDGKKISWEIFKGSESPANKNEKYEPVDGTSTYQNKKNKDVFKNKRAQCYWALRDRFYLTYKAITQPETSGHIDPDKLISISSQIKNLQKLRSEVCRIPLKNNANGLIQIMDKPEMKKKYKINSPNLADSIMMSMDSPKRVSEDFLKPLKINRSHIY